MRILGFVPRPIYRAFLSQNCLETYALAKREIGVRYIAFGEWL